MTLRQLLKAATQTLQQVSESAQFEAELLLAHALQQSRAYLLAHLDDDITPENEKRFTHLLQRRSAREPIAYILQQREFWSQSLQVTKDTLIPRPETECLVEWVLESFPDKKSQLRVADLGTGSGAIAIALAIERPHWQITATDVSQSALDIASNNAQALALSNISFHQGNWFTAFPGDAELFDIMVSNPPYLAETEWLDYAAGLSYEPRNALVSGIDGLDAITEIVNTAKDYLKPAGCLFIEHGFRQGESVRQLFLAADYASVATRCDLAHLERITSGFKK